MGVDDSTESYPYGEPLGVTPHHQPVRFPQLARSLGTATGGGSVPARPVEQQSHDDQSPDVPVAPAPSAAPHDGPTQE